MKKKTRAKKPPLVLKTVAAPLKKLGAPATITRNSKGTPNKKLTGSTAARNLEFGRRLRALMMSKGIRQIRMAELLGIGRDSMSTYANGKNIPHGARLEKMASILEVTTTELVPRYGVDIPDGSGEGRSMTLQFDLDGSIWLTIKNVTAKMASHDEAKWIMDKLKERKPENS